MFTGTYVRSLLIVCFLAVSLITIKGTSQPVFADDYPDKDITVTLHVSPGGGTDTMARTVWKHAERLSGTHFVIENNSGAGGQIGYTKLATSEPDGYTVGAITTLSIVTHELTRKGVIYSLKESFQPIGRVILDPSVVVVRADSPFKTLEDLITAAKEKPGELNWGGTFLYGAHHVHYIMFERATGAKLQYVPFDGAAESRAALLGGHIDVGAGGVSEYVQLVKEGKARILVVGGEQRYPALPDVPVYTELGYDVQIGSNRGFAVPSGTPEERTKWLEDLLAKVMKDPQFLEEAKQVGIADTLAYLPGDKFYTYLKNLQDLMREILPADKLVQ
ncbi:MAG: tripartite tricarboxylate transporter substrate binding protein [Desulfofustis sp.]|jgi:tripartite-type tricarboxylate transporter receptor subunit TctC